jgi:RNA polymerase II subunit A C-terminal domain phosphatase SSU72
LLSRESNSNCPVHIINVDIIDNREQAAKGGLLILQLAEKVVQAKDLDQDIDGILNDFEAQTGAKLLHTISFY